MARKSYQQELTKWAEQKAQEALASLLREIEYRRRMTNMAPIDYDLVFQTSMGHLGGMCMATITDDAHGKKPSGAEAARRAGLGVTTYMREATLTGHRFLQTQAAMESHTRVTA